MYWIEEVAKERAAGAHELTQRCVSHLTALCRSASTVRSSSLLTKLTDVGSQLVAAKPTMAPIMNLVNGLLLHTQENATSGLDSEAVRKAAIEYLEAFRKESSSSLDHIARRVVTILEPGSRVFTLSASETVARSLEEAHRVGLLGGVVVAESRPVLEGTQLARRLGAFGIDTTLVVDAAIPVFVRECAAVMVGADAVGSTSFMNKTGTWCAMRAAREAGRARYVLAAEDKLVPPDWPFPSDEGDPREVSAEHWANVTPRNPCFETVSLRDITGVITESGVYSGLSLGRRTANRSVCESLRPVLSRATDTAGNGCGLCEGT